MTRYSGLGLACALSKAEFQAEIESILQTIFVAGDDTFSPTPFAADIPVKRILFNWDYRYVVDPPLLDAVVTAARQVGDVGFFFLTLWRISPDAYPYAWYIPFSAIDVYQLCENSPIGDFIFSEQVIVSPSGQWGIMTTHEFHMLLGCNEAFIGVFHQMVPDLESQVFTFLGHWRHCKINYGTQTDWWLPGLMKQVYGPEVAEKMLHDANLP